MKMLINPKNILLFALFTAILALPSFSSSYIMRLAILSCIYIMTTVGLNIITGYFGSMIFGFMAYFGFGAYMAALLSLYTSIPMMINILLGGLLTLLFSALTANLCLRLRGPYFSIFTLALANILKIVVSNWVSVTNGPMGLQGITIKPFVLGPVCINLNNEGPMFYVMLAAVLLTLLVTQRLVNSSVGRAWEAIRGHEELAASIGIDRFFYGTCAVMTAGFIAGTAGGFYAYYITIVSPNVFAFSWMTTWLIMVITGGLGTMYGPVVGAVLFTFIPELLRTAENWRLVIFGVLLIFVILFMPKGILPLVQRGIGALHRRTSDSEKNKTEEATL